MIDLPPQEKIAKILRTDKEHFKRTISRLAAVSEKQDVIEKIAQENDRYMAEHLQSWGGAGDASAKEVYDALTSKIEADDYHIFEVLASPNTTEVADCQRVGDRAYQTVNPPRGFFLKLAKAEEFLRKEPPRQVMTLLGYSTVDELLAKEDLLEVYSALRFIEGNEWLNNVFFKQYETLTPADFEERDIVVKALGKKWATASEKFIAKKHHNISHLKELGVVFIIPALLGISGELLRMFALVMHYLHEIPYYAGIFREIAGHDAMFSRNFISLLRGDVLDRHFPDSDRSIWLVVQRYLAKDDSNDWRLFYPRINPEALHWSKTEESLSNASAETNGFSNQLAFWHSLDWVGGYFKDENGVDVLVSFDLVDSVMALVKQREHAKYLYHHQEALWNKVFSEYFGQSELERYSREYLLQGYFEV